MVLGVLGGGGSLLNQFEYAIGEMRRVRYPMYLHFTGVSIGCGKGVVSMGEGFVFNWMGSGSIKYQRGDGPHVSWRSCYIGLGVGEIISFGGTGLVVSVGTREVFL